jgi:DNA mismatch repair protein MutL
MINMIAAGEVIERPASVVKELVENSIDAGATKITVSVEDGGRKLISVTDNGRGMDGDDLARAFESHTTSKIKSSSDLQAISTLGFRGEALASIASIAQVRAVSRPVPSTALRTGIEQSEGTQDTTGANCIEIDCGNKDSISPCSGDYGTTIQIRDIFYKLPARRKFLRTANTEMGHISEQFTRIALANDGLDLTLTHNGRELHRLLSGQGLCQRIAELFPGLSIRASEDLIEAASNEKGLSHSCPFGQTRHFKNEQQISIRISEWALHPRQVHLARDQRSISGASGAQQIPRCLPVHPDASRRLRRERASDKNRSAFLQRQPGSFTGTWRAS